MLCERCRYYSHQRVGWVCAYTGEYNPRKDECPHFQDKFEVEVENHQARELTYLVYDLVRRLSTVDVTDVDAIRELKVAAKTVLSLWEVIG